jgi:hypothetical protein
MPFQSRLAAAAQIAPLAPPHLPLDILIHRRWTLTAEEPIIFCLS